MTLPIARDLSRNGIRVNVVSPGIFDTPMLALLREAGRTSLGQQVLFPQRISKPDEFSDLMISIAKNGYLNGESIRLDGGIRMQPK